MNIYEIMAVATGLISVILTIYKSYYSWIIGLLSIFLYAYVFYFQSLYVNTGLQFIFAIQSIHGLWYWTRNRKRRGEDVTVSKFKFNFYNTLVMIISIVSMCTLLSIFFRSKLDCISSTLSIVATLLMAKGKIENWILWIMADIIYIVMFFQNGLYLSVILYIIFMILCIVGYKQ